MKLSLHLNEKEIETLKNSLALTISYLKINSRKDPKDYEQLLNKLK